MQRVAISPAEQFGFAWAVLIVTRPPDSPEFAGIMAIAGGLNRSFGGTTGRHEGKD